MQTGFSFAATLQNDTKTML